MPRSPCVATSSFKSILPIRDFKGSSYLKVSPLPAAKAAYRSSLSPFSQCNSSKQSHTSVSPSQYNHSSSPHDLTHRRESFNLSVDSPQRILFVSKIKTTTSSSPSFLGRGRFGRVVLARYKGDYDKTVTLS